LNCLFRLIKAICSCLPQKGKASAQAGHCPHGPSDGLRGFPGEVVSILFVIGDLPAIDLPAIDLPAIDLPAIELPADNLPTSMCWEVDR
jgi:hypothetical protein